MATMKPGSWWRILRTQRLQDAAVFLGICLFHKGTAANTADDVVRPYVEVTGIALKDLVGLFSRKGWKPKYGGEKWASIAEHLLALIVAVKAGDKPRARRLAASAGLLEHNSGKLIPKRNDWNREAYLREEWPQLCRSDDSAL